MLIDFKYLFNKYKVNATGALHVGANVGEEAKAYYDNGIKRSIWIEANQDIYKLLKINLMAYPEAICFNYCIGDEEGKAVIFWISNNGSQSSSILELGTHKIAHPEVKYIDRMVMPMTRIDTLFHYKKKNIKDYTFLNIDLQGAELMALKGMGDMLHEINYAYLEVNKAELYIGCPLVEEIDTYLAGYGLYRVETHWCGNTNWGDGFYIRK